MKKLNVAVVGLSFGLEFVPIYLEHPDVEKVYLVDTDASLLHVAQNRYGIPEENCTCEIQEVLDDPDIDAVHLVTPPATHAPLSIRVLKAGKHCGCTIPMGLSLDELNAVIAARKESNKNYMFMETTVFQREFLYVKQLHEKGELGRIQYMTCAHYQDMEGWPSYWNGFPPLMHPTHAVAPCLMLAGHLPKRVYGRGSGKIRDELVAQYNSPFAFESALIELENSDLTIEMERFLYGVARSYSECFRIYGEKKSFEWQQLASESPVCIGPKGGRGKKTRSCGITFRVMKGMAAALNGKETFDLVELADAMRAGTDSIMNKAGSKPGEKTILDAMVPAVKVLEDHSKDAPKVAFEAAMRAAAAGFEETRAMKAVWGRAAYYGEKSVGLLDGGAAVGKLIFEAINESCGLTACN